MVLEGDILSYDFKTSYLAFLDFRAVVVFNNFSKCIKLRDVSEFSCAALYGEERFLSCVARKIEI